MAEKAIIKRALLAADSALEKYIAANKKNGHQTRGDLRMRLKTKSYPENGRVELVDEFEQTIIKLSSVTDSDGTLRVVPSIDAHLAGDIVRAMRLLDIVRDSTDAARWGKAA